MSDIFDRILEKKRPKADIFTRLLEQKKNRKPDVFDRAEKEIPSLVKAYVKANLWP